MFSALGSAGTPYTPRPISNLVPDPVAPIGVAGGGAGGGLSGTALWADYLNRYPDVAKEAKANPGAYGDLNNDNVIDDTDFAIGHYAIAGQKDGHTLAAKTGGYIQGSSGTKNMYDPRFQVMRKADGGAVVTEPVPTTASSTADILRQLQGQPSRSLPVDPNLARSLAVDPRALAESYRSGATGGPSAMSVMQQPQSPYSGYEPGTMGGMYHYGEAPTGEKQFFNYAMAPGATPPWMANTPTGTGVYNMFGVKTGGVGAGGGGVGGVGTTGTTGTTDTTTTGTTTTPAATTTPVSAADMAKWSAYVNAYPDLAAAFAANNVAYGDFNHDGKVDIADFGLGQYTNYGQKEGRSLTGPASTAPANTPISAANRGLYSAYVTNTPDLAAAYAANPKAYGDFNNDGVIDIADFGLGQYTNYGKAEGRSLTGPAVPANTTIGGAPDTTVNAPTYKATDADAQKLMSSLSTFQDPTGFHYGDTDYAKLLLDQYRSGALDPASGTGQQLKGAGFKGGGAATRNDFSVQGPGTGRSDSIPAALSDGEYVMDAETVALLGDGSSKAGAKKLDAMRSNLRKAKGRNLVKGRFSVNAKAPEAYLSGGRT
jgi:hypothetical protein